MHWAIVHLDSNFFLFIHIFYSKGEREDRDTHAEQRAVETANAGGEGGVRSDEAKGKFFFKVTAPREARGSSEGEAEGGASASRGLCSYLFLTESTHRMCEKRRWSMCMDFVG